MLSETNAVNPASRVCPKCGGRAYPKYYMPARVEQLKYDCTTCGYWWTTPCLDAEEIKEAMSPARFEDIVSEDSVNGDHF